MNDFLASILEKCIPQEQQILIPAVITSILVTFNVSGQKGYVMGGAVRDTILGREMKDYDVFVPMTHPHDAYEEKMDVNEIGIQARRFGYDVQDVTQCGGSVTGTDLVARVIQLSRRDEKPIEIILCRCTIEEYMNQFTVSISRCRYDVFSGEYILSPEFVRTMETKEIMVYKESYAASVYIDRIMEKYGNEYTCIRPGVSELQEGQADGFPF